MIKEIAKPSPNKYGKYFLSTEAPGDEEELESPIKRNTKVIDVKPNNRRRIDFTDGAEEIEEEIPEEPSEEDQFDQGPDFDTGDGLDFNQDEPTEIDQPDDGTEPTVDDGTNDVTDTTTGEEDFTQDTTTPDNTTPDQTTTEPSVEGDGTDVSVDQTDGPVTDTGEDFTDGADMDSGEVSPDETQAPEDQKKGPGLEYDSTRKYNLFENYMSLSNALTNYITKLENNMGENYEENLILKTSTEKLREIYQLCYDYMTMKFEISSYVQSLLFFQNLVIMVQLVFDLLSKTKKKLKK